VGAGKIGLAVSSTPRRLHPDPAGHGPRQSAGPHDRRLDLPREDKHWHLLDKGDGDKRLYAEGINRTLDGRIRCSGAHAYSKSPNETIRLNEWQHVAMSWSQATNLTRLYHNGAEVRYARKTLGPHAAE